MADELLSQLMARYSRLPVRDPGLVEDRRRERPDLAELLRYNESAERMAANERYQAQPIAPLGRPSFDAGFWDIDRLAGPGGLAGLAQRYGKPQK